MIREEGWEERERIWQNNLRIQFFWCNKVQIKKSDTVTFAIIISAYQEVSLFLCSTYLWQSEIVTKNRTVSHRCHARIHCRDRKKEIVGMRLEGQKKVGWDREEVSKTCRGTDWHCRYHYHWHCHIHWHRHRHSPYFLCHVLWRSGE